MAIVEIPMNQYDPETVTRPGVFVCEAMEERGLVFVPGWAEYIVMGYISIDVDYANRLSELLPGTTAELWLSMQEAYDKSLEKAYPPNFVEYYRGVKESSYRCTHAMWKRHKGLTAYIRIGINRYYRFKRRYVRLCPIDSGWVEGIGLVVDICKQQRDLDFPFPPVENRSYD